MKIKKPTVDEFEQYRKDCNIHGYKTPHETLKEALDYFFGTYQKLDK